MTDLELMERNKAFEPPINSLKVVLGTLGDAGIAAAMVAALRVSEMPFTKESKHRELDTFISKPKQKAQWKRERKGRK